MYCNIIVTAPVEKEYTYLCPQNLVLKKGDIVEVSFGKRKNEVGLVSKVYNNNKLVTKNIKFKEVSRKINKLRLNNNLIDFIDWVSKYTLYSKGNILKMIIPNLKIIDSKLKNKKEIQKFDNIFKIDLNAEQKEIYNLIKGDLKNKHQTIVLEGVTGSGKTEVFFEAVKNINKKNLQALILLPEISLTPNIEKRYINRFGIEPEIWHSKISNSKKSQIWNRCYSGKSKIIVGTRSSLFLPFKKLGLIVVDEEHDTSYKQEENVRYQARDMAIVRSNIEKIPIILSTATPSLETYYNIYKKRYKHVFLSKQYSGLDLPKINVIDLVKEKLLKNEWISKIIIEAISRCLKNNKQSLLFLNRRGYAPLTVCSSCGYRMECNNCSSWLVMHNKKNILCCHHCGFSTDIIDKCFKCKSENTLKFIGPGIERLAEELKKNFPQAKLEILSSENMNTNKKIKEMIDRIEQKKIDILVGTQILAKGHHFPNLSLVGIIDADAGLMGGDLRASEHTYNLLQQVSGRAGRSFGVGDVYIQTYFADNPLIRSLKNRDRNSFLKYTLDDRNKFNLPPFAHLISVILSGSSKIKVLNFGKEIVNGFQLNENISIMGPVEAPISLLRGKYRYRILFKSSERRRLNLYVGKWLKNIVSPSNIKLSIDVDPYSFL